MKFGARRNKLFFRTEDVSQPFVTHNPELLELVAPQLEAELKQQLAGGSLKEQAKGILKRLLAGEKPRLEDVAVELRVSARTLQRRLLEEGMTFHNLVEEARREMAQHYLRQPVARIERDGLFAGIRRPELLHSRISQVGGDLPRRVAIDSLPKGCLTLYTGGCHLRSSAAKDIRNHLQAPLGVFSERIGVFRQ